MKFVEKHFKKIMTVMVFLLGAVIAWSWIQYKERETTEGKLKAMERILNPANKSATPLDR